MKIRELRLQASRLFPLLFFYRDVLGMQVKVTKKDLFTLQAGDSLLIFEQTNDPLSRPFYHFAFNIPSNKIEEAHEWLEEKVELLWLEDYKSHIADFSDWGAKSVYIFDPAGNIVELIARFDLKDSVDEPFGSHHIRNISEIGLVFPPGDVRKQVASLLQQYDLTHFSKQPSMEHFCAIGDDEGLFICVPEKRNWYPTHNKSSEIFPLQLKFMVGEEEHELSF